MVSVTKDEREIRINHMKMFGQWLKDQGRTQRWGGKQLGIYHGYLSNLVTGKQMASEDICRKAGQLMGPLDTTTGKPYGSAWTQEEARERVREEQRKADKKLHERLRKKTKKKKKVQKKVAKKRATPAKPEDLPFEVETSSPKSVKAVAKLTKKPRITSWGIPQSKRKLDRSTVSRHPGFKSLSPEEQRAATDVILMCIKTMPPMTGDGLVKVIEAVVEGFTSPYVA